MAAFGNKLQGCETMHHKKKKKKERKEVIERWFHRPIRQEVLICDVICWSVWLGNEPTANPGAGFDTSGLKASAKCSTKHVTLKSLVIYLNPFFLFFKSTDSFFFASINFIPKNCLIVHQYRWKRTSHGSFPPPFFFFGKDINMHITVLDEKYNHKRLFHHLCPGVHRMHKTPVLAERSVCASTARRSVSLQRRKYSASVNGGNRRSASFRPRQQL